MICRAPDKRSMEDNSNIIFLISQQKHMLSRRDSSNDG